VAPQLTSFLCEGRVFQNAVETRPSCRKRSLPGRRSVSQGAERGREHDRVEGGVLVVAAGEPGGLRASVATGEADRRPDNKGERADNISREAGIREASAGGGVARSPAKRESSGVNQNNAVALVRRAEMAALCSDSHSWNVRINLRKLPPIPSQ
jgi:hypothetical protein